SISYAAESAGQTLTIKWTLSQGTRGDANVTLQAAALTAPGANNPPAVSITGPADGANFSANDDISVTADAADADGTIARAEFFQNDAQLGESTSSPYSLTWTNALAGKYILSAKATDNGGTAGTSAPVEIFVHGAGGTLSGSVTFFPSSVDLSSEGTSDWAHWGLSSPMSFNHKAGVPQQIGTFVKIGTNATQRLKDN